MEITYLEAIRQALWEEMDRDDQVFMLGQDIGVYGGAFKVTKGFLEKFGPERVIDTPLSESAIVEGAGNEIGEPVPLVIQAPYGGGIHAGPYHSQSPEAWFFHVAGLKLVAPSTPRDAKGLLKAAIRDPNPVISFENKYLYRHIK